MASMYAVKVLVLSPWGENNDQQRHCKPTKIHKLNIFHVIKKKKKFLSDANSRFKEEEVREEAKYDVQDKSTCLGLLPTFAGVLPEIILSRTSFSRIVANHTSEGSLITADYDKNII